MIIGVIKEIMQGERRVSSTPETVAQMVKSGLDVRVEKSAGEGSFYSDAQYIEAGAKIMEDCKEIYEQADVILKVKEPQFNKVKNLHEVDMMHKGQYLITFIHPAAPANHDMVRNMAKQGVISLTLDGVPRITRAQKMDALTSMSTCAGYKGMLMAANILTVFAPSITCAVGTVKPINVLVIGTGVAGLQALATAKRLGAIVHAVDIRPDAVEQAKSLGGKPVDSGVPADVSIGAGGYALELSDEWLKKERDALKDIITQCDIVFLGALVPNKMAPILLTEEMVKTMKPGSVIVDVSIDQGGNCEITSPAETVVKHGVSIIGIKNIPGQLPTSSTWMFSNNMLQMLNYLLKDGKIVIDKNDEIIQGILTTCDGEIVHEGTLEAMGK